MNCNKKIPKFAKHVDELMVGEVGYQKDNCMVDLLRAADELPTPQLENPVFRDKL